MNGPKQNWPKLTVCGRTCYSETEARALAQSLANSTGRAVSIMQKDDQWLAPFELSRIDPEVQS
jgi:hypothetical protein